jgi:hypothetical protein
MTLSVDTTTHSVVIQLNQLNYLQTLLLKHKRAVSIGDIKDRKSCPQGSMGSPSGDQFSSVSSSSSSHCSSRYSIHLARKLLLLILGARGSVVC